MQFKLVFRGIRLAFVITLLGWLPLVWIIAQGEAGSYYLPTIGLIIAAGSLIISSCRTVVLSQGKMWMSNGLAVAAGYLLIKGALVQTVFPIQIGGQQVVNYLMLLAFSIIGSYMGYLMTKTVFIRRKGDRGRKIKKHNLTKPIS